MHVFMNTLDERLGIPPRLQLSQSRLDLRKQKKITALLAIAQVGHS